MSTFEDWNGTDWVVYAEIRTTGQTRELLPCPVTSLEPDRTVPRDEWFWNVTNIGLYGHPWMSTDTPQVPGWLTRGLPSRLSTGVQAKWDSMPNAYDATYFTWQEVRNHIDQIGNFLQPVAPFEGYADLAQSLGFDRFVVWFGVTPDEVMLPEEIADRNTRIG